MKLSRIYRSFLIVLIILCLGIPIWGVKEYANVISGSLPKSYNNSADCGVVLTGGSGRIREGLAVLSRGLVRTLIISGVHQHSTLAEMVPEVIYYPEIDLDRVILERRSNSTSANAQQSLVVVEALGCKSILLITSDYHMYRALQTFEHFFPPTIPVAPYVVPSDRIFGSKLWLTATDEFFKYLFYRTMILI